MIFSVMRGQYFLLQLLITVWCQVAHVGKKFVYFELFDNGPNKFLGSVKFSFSIKGNGSFLCGCCFKIFC